MDYEKTPQTIECEGMCFDPSRVLTEIFTLDAAYQQTGLPLDAINENFYLQEVARTISVIALQCRQQMTSYFFQVPDATSASREDRLAYISGNYESANQAVTAITGNLISSKDGLKPLRFYDLIGKLVHVEKWIYPVQATVRRFDTADSTHSGPQLLVHVTKRGKEPVTGNLEEVLVCIPWFIQAARVFITGCSECSSIYRHPINP